MFAFPFRDENRKQSAYWRDVGTLDAYYEANMDLIVGRSAAEHVRRALADSHLPAATCRRRSSSSQKATERRGQAMDSIVCLGSIVSGGEVERSILGPNTRVNSYARVEDSILFDDVDVGRHARIRRAIIDKGVRIPPGFEIGFDPDEDRQRGFTVSDNGVVVIAKADGVEHLESAPSRTSLLV